MRTMAGALALLGTGAAAAPDTVIGCTVLGTHTVEVSAEASVDLYDGQRVGYVHPLLGRPETCSIAQDPAARGRFAHRIVMPDTGGDAIEVSACGMTRAEFTALGAAQTSPVLVGGHLGAFLERIDLYFPAGDDAPARLVSLSCQGGAYARID